MIAMLDSNKLDESQNEIGCKVEQLLTPLTRFSRQRKEDRFAIDNGAYSNFDAQGFLSLLKREEHAKNLCRFVACPDIVGSAIRTCEAFEYWESIIFSWPLALVCQDGQENIHIPWGKIQAVFIGGSTEWKMGKHAAAIVKAANVMGKWCHVGRVNTPGRFEYFETLGADSIDGSGLARFSEMRLAIHKAKTEPRLDL